MEPARASMSAARHCGGRAAAEGFFEMLKRERVNRCCYQPVPEARSDVFEDSERFHNPRIRRRLEAEDERFRALTRAYPVVSHAPYR